MGWCRAWHAFFDHHYSYLTRSLLVTFNFRRINKITSLWPDVHVWHFCTVLIDTHSIRRVRRPYCVDIRPRYTANESHIGNVRLVDVKILQNYFSNLKLIHFCLGIFLSTEFWSVWSQYGELGAHIARGFGPDTPQTKAISAT